MSGTNGALRAIEFASTRLCQLVGESVRRLGQTLAAQTEAEAVATAVQALDHRLKLIQRAWGLIEDPMTLEQIKDLVGGLPESVAVDLASLPQESVFCAVRSRIVLNLLLLAAECLPVGGNILLAGTPEDLFVRIHGPSAAWPVGIAVCLLNEAEAQAALTDGRNLQMGLTALFAMAADIRLSLLIPPTAQDQPAILRLGG